MAVCVAFFVCADPLSWSVIQGAPPTFTDVTVAAGLNHVQTNLPASMLGSQFSVSGGGAVGDFDGDGFADLYVTRLEGSDILYRNRGDGTFEDVTTSAFGAGLSFAQHGVLSNGAGWADVNNDGHLDLYVTSLNGNRYHLYINDGQGQFTEEAVARGADLSSPDTHFGNSIAFGDYDLDGYLDIFVAEWRLDTQNPNGAMSHNRLLRNLGAENPGNFEDVTIAAGTVLDDIPPRENAGVFGFTPRFTDLDRDGHPDLVLAADGGTSRVYWNNGDGTFLDGTEASGVAGGDSDMGLATGDFNGDGLTDLFFTAIGIQGQSGGGNRLFVNEGNRLFANVTDEAGVRWGGFGWGTNFIDFDNDGDLDLAMTNGVRGKEESIIDTSILWRNDDGLFYDVSAEVGVTDDGFGTGVIVFDFDNDGDQDLLIINHAGAPVLYRNDGGNENDWLRIDLEGVVSNHFGIGAQIEVTPDLGGPTLFREVTASSNWLSQSEITAHFGIGQSDGIIDLVTIYWPSGIVQQLTDVPANTTLLIVESVVPEPQSWLLALLGGLGCYAVHRRRRRFSKSSG